MSPLRFPGSLLPMVLAAVAVLPAAAQTFTISPNALIPPGAPTSTVGTTCVGITVPSPIVISDVNVQLRITHTFDADLEVFLRSPAGTTVPLFARVGDGGDNFGDNGSAQNTVIDDEAVTDIGPVAAPFIGSFNPEGSESLSAFDGQNALGQWQFLVDDVGPGDVGTLHFVGLQFNDNGGVIAAVTGACEASPHTSHQHHPIHNHHGRHGHTAAGGNPPHGYGHQPGLTADTTEVLLPSGAAVSRIFVAAVSQDGVFNTLRPARRGSVVELFGSAVDLALADDTGADSLFRTAPADGRLLRTRRLPEVWIGDAPAEVLFSGLAPGLTGVWQINVRVPEAAPLGRGVPLAIFYEGRVLPRKLGIAIE